MPVNAADSAIPEVSLLQLSRAFLMILVLALTWLPTQASRVRRGPTSSKHKAVSKHVSGKQDAGRPRAIDDERATQIQGALVKAGYLHEVTGHWDSSSEAAMQKLQGDNGWQTKLIPDSRALIKLGLGPEGQNPSATFTQVPSATEGGK